MSNFLNLSRWVAVREHLAHSDPPHPEALIPVCEAAVDAAEAGDWDAEIELPNGNVVSASEVVDRFHLHEFVTLTAEGAYDEEVEV